MFLIIDKPEGWTSHDVVAKMRGILRERKIGHLGTLDPLATGVLVLAVGRDSTKKISQYMGCDKEYEAVVELGRSSDTYDREGVILVNENWKEKMLEDCGKHGKNSEQIIDGKILEVLRTFEGETMQMPPAYSAKKIAGKKAYELARAGKVVELKPVKVSMEFSKVKIEAPFVKCTVKVSSGTYIRSLAHDLGEKLGCGGILNELRRTRVGDFLLKDAKKIEDFQAKG